MTDHPHSVEPLAWDSEFFGVGIGRVDLDGADDDDLARFDRQARTLDLDCLYGSLDPADAPATVRVQRAGYLFVEAATMFTLRPDEPQIPAVPGVDIRVAGPADEGLLEPAARGLAPWSRFAVDPRFGPEQALRLQRAVLARAATCATGERQLLVAEREGVLLALITRSDVQAKAVDGVWATRRGSGAARQLIQVSREWAAPARLLGGPIAARNILALRYVSHCGYRVSQVRYLYHRWLT
jgi:dTDP-4-amino-4,6-dideoxy-D-galactose acyltransferase